MLCRLLVCNHDYNTRGALPLVRAVKGDLHSLLRIKIASAMHFHISYCELWSVLKVSSTESFFFFKHIKGLKERYLLGQNTACAFSG